MSNNSLDNNNTSKDLTCQSHSKEPSINILSKLNSIANENFHQIIPPIVCEICYKADNLIICEICKNGYHQKCLDSVFLPEPFICFNCKKQFTEEEINAIINNPYNQSHLQRKGIIDKQKMYKEFEDNKKVKKKLQLNTFINPTKIIELEEEDNDNNNNNNNNNIDGNKNNFKEKFQDKNEDKNNNEIYLNKKKNNKKINDNNLVENMNENNGEENYEKSENKTENKSVKKETKNKIKLDFEKNGADNIPGENDNYESSIMSKSQEITLDKYNFKNKKRKKENSIIKNKSHSNHRNSSPTNNNINNNKNNLINNNENKSSKEKNLNNKDELSIHQSSSISTKKNVKKKHTDIKNEKEQNLLSSLTHTDPQYKRRKIKIGISRQCNMYEFTDKYENKINFDEEEYERNDLVQVWSVEKNPLSEEELNNYINTARLFWNYRNIHIEDDLCADFFIECDQKMKNKKISTKLKSKITKLIKELKELIKRGIDLNSHYDEMSLRVLHLCKYKTNVALLFLYKGLNPFIEEVEEGFKHDIYFFQDEIYSFINNGDFFDSDN